MIAKITIGMIAPNVTNVSCHDRIKRAIKTTRMKTTERTAIEMLVLIAS